MKRIKFSSTCGIYKGKKRKEKRREKRKSKIEREKKIKNRVKKCTSVRPQEAEITGMGEEAVGPKRSVRVENM